MKVRDEAAWQARKAALIADGEMGQAFLVFVEDWAEETERYLASTAGLSRSEAYGLNFTLRFVEEERSRVGAHYLGQMLAVLAEHWCYGEAMMTSLSPIEQRLVEDMVLIKIAESQAQAEGDTPS